MIRYMRPVIPDPADFAARAAAVEHRVRQHVDAHGNVTRFSFPELWKRYRDVFAAAQHSKCAYCEKTVEPYGEPVEHFFPKAEVHELRHPGRINKKGKVVDRRRGTVRRPGYYWKAYDWENWLFACAACNSSFKLNYFPLEWAPGADPLDLRAASPLLLNPYDDDPLKFLTFDELGAVRARSELPPTSLAARRAQATIDTCGLFRVWLVNQRLRVAQQARVETYRAQQAWHAGDQMWLKHSVDALLREGADAKPHAGVVRALVEEHLVPWAQLHELPDCLHHSMSESAAST